MNFLASEPSCRLAVSTLMSALAVRKQVHAKHRPGCMGWRAQHLLLVVQQAEGP